MLGFRLRLPWNKGSFFRGETKEKENARSSTVVFDILTAIKSLRESLQAADWEAQYQRSFGLPLMYHFLALWPWADGLSLPSFLTYKMEMLLPSPGVYVITKWKMIYKKWSIKHLQSLFVIYQAFKKHLVTFSFGGNKEGFRGVLVLWTFPLA